MQLATAYNRLKRKDDARPRASDRRPPERRSAGEAEGRAVDGAGSDDDAARRRRRLLRAARRAVRRRACRGRVAQAPARRRAEGRRRNGAAQARRDRGTAEFDRLVEAATEARQARALGRGHRALREGGEAQADVRRGLLVSGHGVLLARRLRRMPRGVSQGRAAGAEERRRVRVPRPVRVRPEGLRPVAAAPAAVADPRRRRHRRSSAASRATTPRS